MERNQNVSKFKSHSNAAEGGDASRSSAADMLNESLNRMASVGIEQARQDIARSFYNDKNKTDLILDKALRPKIAKALRSGQYRCIMPMYRDMAAAHTTQYMVEVLGDPKNVTIVNGGSPEDEVAKAVGEMGAEVLHVADLRAMIPTGKFYDLLNWNEKDKEGKVKIPVGKGMSIFWLHLFDEVVREKLPEETVTLQIDSDITNIGAATGQYNPLYYLALPLVMDPDKQYVHIKTASPGRNNEPMMPPRNALHALEDAGLPLAGLYARFTQRLKWMLTGEFAFCNRRSIRNMPHSSGYGAETILAMYLALLNEKGLGDTAQVAIRIPRLDAANTYEKEYVMYDQLSYLLFALLVKSGGGDGRLLVAPGVDALTVADVKEINARMAQREYYTVLGESQGPCQVIATVNDRIIPSIAELNKNGYVDQNVVAKLKGKYCK
jgi:hypothetical protein